MNGFAPPVTVKFMLPSELLLQEILLPLYEESEALITVGGDCVKVILPVLVHPLTSVIVTS